MHKFNKIAKPNENTENVSRIEDIVNKEY